MTFRNTLLTLGLLTAPFAAVAQPVTGPYISLGAGASYLQQQKIRSNVDTFIISPVKHSVGPVGVAAVGWGFGNGLRAEFEGEYRTNDVDSIGGHTVTGQTEQFGGMVNGYYDVDIGSPGFTPYLGAGIGYLVNHYRNYYATGQVRGIDALYRSTGTAEHLAAQAIVGFAYDIADVPGLALTAEYRFTTTPEDLNHAGQYRAGPSYGPAPTKVDGAYNHAGIVGLRYALWAPPAPVAEVAAPVAAAPEVTPTKTYLVFFDWDRADLSPRAREIVAAAASASTHVQTTKIEVNGYTDLSGTAAYNQKLSVRRAKAVEAELVKDGVAQATIDIHGYGESNPLVPTAKGVREPQNRRVEIILK